MGDQETNHPGSSSASSGLGPGSGPGQPTFGDGSAVTGLNLLRAIKRELLALATPAAPQLPEAGTGGHLGSGPAPTLGDPGGGVQGAAAQTPPGSGSDPLSPTVVRQNRHRRVCSDDKRLRANKPALGKRSRPLTEPGFCTKTEVRAKLKQLAKDHGLKTLPGAGTLTLATRKIHGGRDQVIQYIRIAAADGDPHAEVFLHVWDDLKAWEQKLATFDDVCAAAGVAPVKLVKAIVGTAYESSVDVANLIAAHSHPDVVAFTTKMAQTVEGTEDRKMLLQHAGFLPQGKGQTINIGVTASATAQAAAHASADSSVPDFLDDVDALIAPVETVQKQLIDASVPDPDLHFATTPHVDAELVD